MSKLDTDLSNSELLQKLSQLIEKTSDTIKKEIKDEIQEINHSLLLKIENQEKKRRELEDHFLRLQAGHERLEKGSRRNNIIVFGVDVTDRRADLAEFVLDKIGNLLELNLNLSDVNDVYRIKTTKGFIIKIEFLSNLKVREVFKNVTKLRNTGITISQDLSLQERKDREVLLRHMREARAKKYYANIVGSRLKVNGTFYTVTQLESSRNFTWEPKSNSAPATPIPIQNTDEISLEADIVSLEPSNIKSTSSTTEVHSIQDITPLNPKVVAKTKTTNRGRSGSQSSTSSAGSSKPNLDKDSIASQRFTRQFNKRK